ncbi:NAD(P)/FAD-dependent oxidoreductase [Nocardioides guangzhouensis]|uniref:NAD(P)/FAD-dependent oxidoreductase n=1 Tax=Nocardioides guangzhouensis TaxID=2497878 RepID=A0A4Q4ZBR4_9ACTN|nr:NAD(P)/FAD-dependent oxidoreductase [Nocardioides guangzhouensis]RYP85362.1 NAD(P)/FAD-dependent oxidoreductase [Nocardioides guangzhouensis]
MTHQDPSRDVVVVGARCAGTAVARLLAARGHDVLLLDRADLPGDTVSTHGIARGGVVQLARWGLLDRVLATGAPAIRDVTFVTADGELHRRVKDRAGVDLLVAPRRSVLDAILLDAALAAGADLRTGTTVTGLLRDRSGRVTGVRTRDGHGRSTDVAARHVVAADGLRSRTVQRLGAATLQGFEADASLFYFYVADVDWRGIEFHVSPDAFAGAFPTNDGQACVWLCRPTPAFTAVRSAGDRRSSALLAALDDAAPVLASRVRRGRIVSPVRGCVSPPSYVRQAWGPGWSLVGDAGYHRDPITGHGITDAFRDAELLAEALHDVLEGADEPTSLGQYAAARDAALAETFDLTRALARFPHPARFVELQMQLARALDREATALASRPVPAGLVAAPAA